MLGATSMVRLARHNGIASRAPGCVACCNAGPPGLATVALATKMARIAWAVMTRGQVYRPAGRAVEAVA